MNQATNTRTVVVEKEFSHPPEKLWRALTQGALMEEWLMTNDFQPTKGHKFTLRAQPMPHWDGIIHCEVLTIEPCKKLSYSWNSMGLVSVVEFTLAPTQKGVLLRMEQSGFRADQDAAYNGATFGWQKFLEALVGVVDKLD
jgi:uncharacterized protein YndB with AHSA1/START domain